MKNHCFEIKVALLGNVSAGKTTVLNALLGDKFGEVAMKRTTTCANYFRIHAKSSSSQQWPIIPDDPRSAESTYKETIKDNQVKISKGESVKEKYFDVELDDPFIPCRDDTRIVLVDIPGINEAGTNSEYKEYVSANWTTFDCVVIVMDGKQGVNTEEQVFVLKFVKQNLDKKDIPVIVVCNKVDEPDDEEQIELLKEAENEFKKIFYADNTAVKKKNLAFLRISALHAYIYQSGSRMSMEQFAKFEPSLIEKLGRDQFGRKKWSKLSIDEKLKEAFTIVKDKESLQDALNDSNFSFFLSTLQGFLGGEDNQRKILEKQICASLQAMSDSPYESGKIVKNVKFLSKQSKLVSESSIIGKQLADLDKYFWAAHKNYENYAFDQLRSNWPKLDVHVLAGPMDEIAKYLEFLSENNLDEKYEQVREAAKSFVLRLVYLAAEIYSEENIKTFWITYFNTKHKINPAVSLLSPMDWYLIWSSMLLPASNPHFYTTLGKEKILLELLQKKTHQLIHHKYKEYECPSCFEQLTNQDCSRCCIRYLFSITDHCTTCSGSCPNTKCFPNRGGLFGSNTAPAFGSNNTSTFGSNTTSAVLFGSSSKPFSVGPGIVESCNHCGTNKSKPLLDSSYKCKMCSHQYVMNYEYKIMNEGFETTYKEDGTIVPSDPNNYNKLVHVVVPDSINDPNHFGHIPHKFCQLMDRIDLLQRDVQKK